MPRAFITGITGQDGSYLTEFLLAKGYEVHGVVRRTSSLTRSRIDHFFRDPQVYGRRLFLHYADLDEPNTLRRALLKAQPDEVYNLAGQSHVGLSFEMPETTCGFIALSALRLLEMIRDLPQPPRLFQAASSEIFGRPEAAPQDERTPIAPATPYGCAMAFATHLVRTYRLTYHLFAGCGIMYNHESPRRGENFVTRKICRAAAAIKLGLQDSLPLGNLDARRDWGHAQDFVRAMWLALQHPEPEDYVLATGRLHTVRDVAAIAFDSVGLDWQRYVRTDPRLLRPTDPQDLLGNAAKAARLLGWTPTVPFEQMIREMTAADLADLGRKDSNPAPPEPAAPAEGREMPID